MKTIVQFRSVVFALLIFISVDGFSQTTDNTGFALNTPVLVKMNDGLDFRGTISSYTDSTIALVTDYGILQLDRSKINQVVPDDYTGEFRFPNPHGTRYFFGPTGMPIKKGEGYYQNLMVVGNFVNYGVTDWFSIGGGFEFISTVSGYPIWFLTPKVGWKLSENWHIGGGAFVGGMLEEGSFYMPYAAITYGSKESNFTVGMGWVNNGVEWGNSPLVMLSGTHRISNTVALLTENYIIPNNELDLNYMGIHGIRIMSEKNAFDIGIILIPQITESIPLPYVGYSRAF